MNQPPDNQEDHRLIQQTLDGGTSAFETLIRKYQDRLLHSMTHVMRNRSDAEDVVQETFIKAYTKLSSFKGDSQFYSWLYRVAHNTAISQIRKRKPALSLSGGSEGCDELLQIQLPSDTIAPSDRLEREEQNGQLVRALGNLSEEHRTILVLREMDEQDYDAIGEILDLPIGTVRSRLHRARSQLKLELERVMSTES